MKTPTLPAGLFKFNNGPEYVFCTSRCIVGSSSGPPVIPIPLKPMSKPKVLKLAVVALLLVALAIGGLFYYRKTKPDRIQKRADAFFQSGEYDKARLEYGNLMK